MWIVRLALRRPYTFIVLGVLIVLLGVRAVRTMPTDIFPDIDIPVISVIWTYSGLPAEEMQGRVTQFSEFTISSNVDDVRSIESQTLNGVSVIKIYFHPGVRIEEAMAQVVSANNSIRGRMPPGINAPVILRFNASSVPILQLALASDKLSESQLYDFGVYRIRQQLAVVQGTTLPTPYGGKPRQIMVDIDPAALQSYGLTANDVSNAVNAQNLVLPSGTAKIGDFQYNVRLNASPDVVDQLNDIPVRTVAGRTVFLRDVGHVRDGSPEQANIVRQDGRRGALLTILKKGNASTVEVVDQIRNTVLPAARAAAPDGLRITELFDQSRFVSAAIHGVVVEGFIAGCLTAAMILLFLGSWRSTLIVAISIPLSILSSLVVLQWMGETLNIMTLGGLALAIGILVDDATVTIENIERIRSSGVPHRQAILEGAAGIATPTLVGTLTICIVFVSVIFLEGPARYLFVSLAMAVVFAMLASYLLSRTLVPVLADYLLRHEGEDRTRRNAVERVSDAFNRRFEQLRAGYESLLRSLIAHRPIGIGVGLAVVASAVLVLPGVGRDFFPQVDAGQFKLHVRAPAGLRIEETERLFDQVEAVIREHIPADERELVLDNIGLPAASYNLAFMDNATVGPYDGEILVALTPGHAPTADYVRTLRAELPRRFPSATFYFQPADIVNQILNFGLPAAIDVQVAGNDAANNLRVARELVRRIRGVRGAADVHLHQVQDGPELFVNVDRQRAAALGISQQDVANNLLVSLSGSGLVRPNFWLDSRSGVPYLVEVATPTYRTRETGDIGGISLAGVTSDRGTPQLLSNVARIERRSRPLVFNHSNVAPVYDVYASAQDRDLGGIARDIGTITAELQKELKPGNVIRLRGQVESMNIAFSRLALGLLSAAVLVYLLMVVNFQSWTDPFIIIMALPGAFAGIVWMLLLTGTTLNVESLMGAIMSIGVASANSILLVSFANDLRREGLDAAQAALRAGETRLRPILMTALAMIIGMVPMALGLGEGGEQNAPLGRAVIGGLAVATFFTLLFVPLMYTLLRREPPRVALETEP